MFFAYVQFGRRFKRWVKSLQSAPVEYFRAPWGCGGIDAIDCAAAMLAMGISAIVGRRAT